MFCQCVLLVFDLLVYNINYDDCLLLPIHKKEQYMSVKELSQDSAFTYYFRINQLLMINPMEFIYKHDLW